MGVSVATKLKAALQNLDKLDELISELVSSYPTVFTDPSLQERLDSFRRAAIEARERLTAPVLSIATIGTTSSGKSTLVNALIGRRIAPIEAGEMSGGVLMIKHNTKRRLLVEKAENDQWESGVWEDISDADAYSRIRDGVMRLYHGVRKNQTCIAPQVLAEGPILPCLSLELLGLPRGLGVEFIDLPGLKSVQDRTNLAVIQKRVHKAFCIVALDYLHTDEEHRKKLIEELKRTVEYLGGRTNSMIFVLNRADQRGMDDEPIETRIRLLQQEIKQILGLESAPDILPFESRLLYRIQCAWGPTDQTLSSTSDTQKQEHLQAFFTECASSIKRHTRDNADLRKWIRDMEDQLDNRNLPPLDDLRTLLNYALEWSGGKRLWESLRVRIESSFSELIVAPALIEVLDTNRTLIDALQTVSAIRKITSQEQLENERNRIVVVRERLREGVGTTHRRFRHQLSKAAEDLKVGDEATRLRLTKELGPGFEGLFSAVNEVTGDLTRSIIAPVRDALKSNRSVYDFEEEMRDVLGPASAKGLAYSYDMFSRRIPRLQRRSGCLFLRYKETDQAGANQIDETERDALRLYKRVRECLWQRANFTLQGRANLIKDALMGLINQQMETIANSCLSELPHLRLKQAIESIRFAQNHEIDLPDKLFELPAAVEQKHYENREVIGQRQEVERYTTGTCFTKEKTRTVTKDVIGSVAYTELVLADEDNMARDWSSGVQKGEISLWEALREWMTDALRESSDRFSSTIESILHLADQALEQQQQMAEHDHKTMLQQWESIDKSLYHLDNAQKILKKSSVSQQG